ncbi:MAG TPA: DivIVA domain-containing protein [Cyclobacteriaceae bacterium]|nr:DivIVA domain-containing protein [Cyclobacteriaceae bacterium]MCB9237181.1 DivIVA domain-containing protein [Flammeovirgaceae bacterium]MCB0500001.1 DivIVA domain-containing protein [Cyclobacteriaceae bacterium]MCO5270890.1 DivIVA domain-containing protein [Cyclobacteriaceae bacterium]MCW5901824.1 DivIVA domain-containing protein [Cyclobacteriaceae bacterium]
MKVTPLDIRQKTFEKVLRGYDKDEVTAFLLSLSQEWERVQDEAKEMRIKLEAAEREVTKLREVESSLYKTLKTAEDTGANVIEQANKAAELHLKEVQLKAEALLNEAKTKAKDTIEQSEATSRQMVEEMEERLKALVQNYKSIESERGNLLGDLKRLAGETLDKVERLKKAVDGFDPDQHLNVAKREAKQTLNPNASPAPEVKTAPAGPTGAAPPDGEKEAAPAPQKSFFDEIQ